MKYSYCIFDMDGTILDTVEDLRLSLNYAFKNAGFEQISEINSNEAKMFFGSGVNTAIRRAFRQYGVNPSEEDISKVEKIYRPYYDTHCVGNTSPYAGITELLKKLKEDGVKCAVVSNKPDSAVKELSEKYFKGLFLSSIGEDEAHGVRKKPLPDTTIAAMKEIGANPEKTVYIGDSEVDLETAKNSSLPAIAVLWGFRSREFLKEHGAEIFAGNTEELYKELT